MQFEQFDGSKELWTYVKSDVRRHETASDGVLILDDTIEEKPYTDENEVVSWHYFSDLKTKKLKKRSSMSKNILFRKLLSQAVQNQVKFDYVLADNWFGSKENLKYIHYDLHKFA